MARKRNSFWSGVAEGYALGNKMWDDWETNKLKSEIADAMNDTGYTEQLSGDAALAHFKQNFQPNEQYASAEEYIKANPDTFKGLENQKAAYIWRNGAVQETAPTQQQIDAYRLNKISDIYAKYGRPEQGLQLRKDAFQLAQAEKTAQWLEKERARTESAWNRENEALDAVKQAETYSPQAYAETQKVLAGLGPEGAAARQIYDQHFRTPYAQALRGAADKLMGLGQFNYAKMLLDRAEKLQQEGIGDIIKAARAGVSGEALANIYNGTGVDRVDRVLDNKPITKDGKVIDREITYVKNGNVNKIRVSELEESLLSPERAAMLRQQAEQFDKMLQARERLAAMANSNRGNPLTEAKASALRTVNELTNEFYNALKSGDYKKAMGLASFLSIYDDNGFIKMKTDDGEVLRNKYEMIVEQMAERAGRDEAEKLKQQLRNMYPNAKFDEIGVDPITGEKAVVVGSKIVPFDKFVAEQEKRMSRGLGGFTLPQWLPWPGLSRGSTPETRTDQLPNTQIKPYYRQEFHWPWFKREPAAK